MEISEQMRRLEDEEDLFFCLEDSLLSTFLSDVLNPSNISLVKKQIIVLFRTPQ